MGLTRSAARVGFAMLLLGAGAAAVSARPPAPGTPPRLEIVAGDPRLDMAWALAQRGMAEDDAARVSVLLVDQIDTRGELQPMEFAWAAEVWWPQGDGSGVAPLRMMRTLVDFRWGTTLQGTGLAPTCQGARAPFLVMQATGEPELPLPAGTTVLVRLLKPWPLGHAEAIGPAALVPVGATPRFECLPVTVDLDHGVAAPDVWPAN